MEIKDMQKEVWTVFDEYNKKNGTSHNPETSFVQLVEEVGELAREVAKEKNDWRGEGFSKDNLAKELIDVICNCLVIAQDYDIDLASVFNEKIAEWRKRWELE